MILSPLITMYSKYNTYYKMVSRLAAGLLAFSSVSHATDYKRMAESLLRDAQQQMKAHDGEVRSIVEGTKESQEKSFFGFDDAEEILTERKPLKAGKTCRASSMTSPSAPKAKYQGDSELFVFVTLGMSDEALKVFSKQAHDMGAVLVIRGLVGNSFQKTHKRLKALGIPIDIDPTIFERFEITRVPTFVLAEIKEGQITGVHDKVRGNVSIRSALELFAMEGDLIPLAKSYLQKGEQA